MPRVLPFRRPSGSTAVTRNPPAGRASASSVPPSSRARSRMPSIPCPCSESATSNPRPSSSTDEPCAASFERKRQHSSLGMRMAHDIGNRLARNAKRATSTWAGTRLRSYPASSRDAAIPALAQIDDQIIKTVRAHRWSHVGGRIAMPQHADHAADIVERALRGRTHRGYSLLRPPQGRDRPGAQLLRPGR